MNKNYDVVVYIGRFQGFTKDGHSKVVEKAKSEGNHVVMAIGSVNKPRSIKNPFSYYERCSMIRNALDNDPQVLFRPIRDLKTDSIWVVEVKHEISKACETIGINYDDAKIALIGMDKDDSSYYIRYFPFWDMIEYEKPEVIVSATDARDILFDENKDVKEASSIVHDTSVKFFEDFRNSEHFKKIKDI